MSYQLPSLPYANDALVPHMSVETLEYHYGKHHKAYVDNLNKLVPGTEFEGMSLEDIITRSSGPVFNNAAQIWNHTFFWNCLSPNGGGTPPTRVVEALAKNFGSVEKFQELFTDASIKHFASGWAWLVKKSDGTLAITSTSNAQTPLTEKGVTPLLTCDVWEHAYYIDHRNRRADFLTAFWKIVNWKFLEENLLK